MLRFPNPSRSFDVSKSRICFWGYDSSIEVSFFIETDTLKKLCPGLKDVESVYLQSFDTERERIYQMADKVYRRIGNGFNTYTLSMQDTGK